jgi:monothiol glutaredoxin
MDEALRKQIEDDIKNNQVLLYMKGDRNEPKCGFSAQVVSILKNSQVNFETRDVLESWELREGIKEFTNWPTVPQLYVKGKFIGGCDIVSELYRKGELKKILAG